MDLFQVWDHSRQPAGADEVNEAEAAEVFDGLMLGDGSLRHRGISADFRMALSGERLGIPLESFRSFLCYVKGILELLGVEACTGHPRFFKEPYKGRSHYKCGLSTRVSSFATSQHPRWYPDGRKEVPDDLALTPISLAYWFMGDGCSYRKKNAAGVDISLCTQGFDECSIERLESQLTELNLCTGRGHRSNTVKGSGIIIFIRYASANNFMNLIDPYVVEPYRYKIKHYRR